MRHEPAELEERKHFLVWLALIIITIPSRNSIDSGMSRIGEEIAEFRIHPSFSPFTKIGC